MAKVCELGGLPVVINEHMPADELWLMRFGAKQTLHVHEGPKAGQDVEVWLREPRIVRIFNLGEMLKLPEPKTYFEMPEPEAK